MILTFQLYKKDDVKYVNVPKYEEFKVADVWSQIKDVKKYNVYFKEYSDKG